MAPEQAIGRMSQIDGRTDLWALGATLFTLISGQLVHEAETLQEALVKAATEPVRSLRTAAPKTPAWLVSVVDRALSFDQSARFATASEMHAALAAHAKDAAPAALAALVEKADSRPSKHPSRRPRQSATHAAVVTPATAGKRSFSGWVLLILVVAGVGVGFAKWADYVEVQRAARPSAPSESEPLVRRTEGPEPSLPEAASASAAPSASAVPALQKPAGASRRRAPAPTTSAQRARRSD
jgi:serine/threonine-protein kinase